MRREYEACTEVTKNLIIAIIVTRIIAWVYLLLYRRTDIVVNRITNALRLMWLRGRSLLLSPSSSAGGEGKKVFTRSYTHNKRVHWFRVIPSGRHLLGNFFSRKQGGYRISKKRTTAIRRIVARATWCNYLIYWA